MGRYIVRIRFGAFLIKFKSLFRIRFDAQPFLITDSGVKQAGRTSFFRCLEIPFKGFLIILFRALSVEIAVRQGDHAADIAKVRAFFAPVKRLFKVLFHAPSVFVAVQQIKHRRRVAFLCGCRKKSDIFGLYLILLGERKHGGAVNIIVQLAVFPGYDCVAP